MSVLRMVLYSVIAAILWGSSYPMVKIALRGLHAVDIAFYRATFATVFMAAVFYRQDIFTIRRKDLRLVIILSLTGVSVTSIFLYLGVEYSTPIKASFLMNTNPIIVALLAHIFLRERLGVIHSSGIVTAAAGTYIIMSNGRLLDLFASETLLGDTMALAASVLWSIYTIIYRRHALKESVNTERLTANIFILAVPMLLVASALTSNPLDIAFTSTEVQMSTVWLGIMSSGMTYLLFNRSLKTLGASTSASSLFIIPLISLVLSYAIIGEEVTYYKVLGGGLILLGVLITQVIARHRRGEKIQTH
mgnify:CR=1 FL=1